MNINLTAPTKWSELTADQFRELTKTMTMHLTREEFLLVAFCKLTGVRRTGGDTYVDADGRRFGMEAWQVADFCERLGWLLEAPDYVPSPGTEDTYLRDMTFVDWWEMDSHMRVWVETGSAESLAIARAKVGMPPQEADERELLHLRLWWQWVSGWLSEKYPNVFAKGEGDGRPQSPFDTLNEISYMVRKAGLYGTPEEVATAPVHTVLRDVDAEIEAAKRMERELKRPRK